MGTRKNGKRWENNVIHLQLFSTLSATDFPTGLEILPGYFKDKS
jgi:hypothetical protein